MLGCLTLTPGSREIAPMHVCGTDLHRSTSGSPSFSDREIATHSSQHVIYISQKKGPNCSCGREYSEQYRSHIVFIIRKYLLQAPHQSKYPPHAGPMIQHGTIFSSTFITVNPQNLSSRQCQTPSRRWPRSGPAQAPKARYR